MPIKQQTSRPYHGVSDSLHCTLVGEWGSQFGQTLDGTDTQAIGGWELSQVLLTSCLLAWPRLAEPMNPMRAGIREPQSLFL